MKAVDMCTYTCACTHMPEEAPESCGHMYTCMCAHMPEEAQEGSLSSALVVPPDGSWVTTQEEPLDEGLCCEEIQRGRHTWRSVMQSINKILMDISLLTSKTINNGCKLEREVEGWLLRVLEHQGLVYFPFL